MAKNKIVKQMSQLSQNAFSAICDSERSYSKATNTWWYNGIILPVLTIFFSSLDGVTMYPMFFHLFSESDGLLWLSTIGIALLINFLPLVAARHLLNYKYGFQEKSLLMFYITIGVFACLFIAVCALRFATMEFVFGDLSQSMTSSAGLMNDTGTSDSSGALAMVILQCITNLGTSAVAFFLSYFSENPLVKKIDTLQLELVELRKLDAVLDSALTEINRYDYDAAAAQEEERYNNHIESIRIHAADLMVTSRLILANKLRESRKLTALADSSKELINSFGSALVLSLESQNNN